MSVAHKLVISKKSDSSRWWFPLGMIDGSVMMAWPAVEHECTVKKRPFHIYKPVTSVDSMADLTILFLDPADWHGKTFEWTSPTTQMHRQETSKTKIGRWSVVPWPDREKADDILVLGATQAFWNLSLAFLRSLASEVGLVLPDDCNTLFEALFSICG